MTTVAILPISDASGEKSYRAIAGDKHSVGKTAGQALDALTPQLGEMEFTGLLVIQSFSANVSDSANANNSASANARIFSKSFK